MKQHWKGWDIWFEYCVDIGLDPSHPGVSNLCDFLWHPRSEKASAVNHKQRKGAPRILAAMTFFARPNKCDITLLYESLSASLVKAVARGNKGGPVAPKKDAAALFFHFVASLEEVVASRAHLAAVADAELAFTCGLLVMVWGSLRWSDAQRTDPTRLSFRDGVLYGCVWESKTSRCGFPFACLASGVSNRNWGSTAVEVFTAQKLLYPGQDFLFSSNGNAFSYLQGLSSLRRCIRHLCNVSSEEAATWSLHSCKKTMLTWALQVGASELERAAQGHHRPSGHQGVVQSYSGDDTLPALRLQAKVYCALRSEWRPLTPVLRGGQAPLLEPLCSLQVHCRTSWPWINKLCRLDTAQVTDFSESESESENVAITSGSTDCEQQCAPRPAEPSGASKDAKKRKKHSCSVAVEEGEVTELDEAKLPAAASSHSADRQHARETWKLARGFS